LRAERGRHLCAHLGVLIIMTTPRSSRRCSTMSPSSTSPAADRQILPFPGRLDHAQREGRPIRHAGHGRVAAWSRFRCGAIVAGPKTGKPRCGWFVTRRSACPGLSRNSARQPELPRPARWSNAIMASTPPRPGGNAVTWDGADHRIGIELQSRYAARRQGVCE